MEPASTHADTPEIDWREILFVTFDLGVPSIFDLEWIIDQAERHECRSRKRDAHQHHADLAV